MDQTTEQKNNAAHCPSCDQPAIRNGMTIICPNCDVTWRYTAEGSKIEKTGEFSELKNRVSAIEQEIGKIHAEPPKPAAPIIDDPGDTNVVDLTDLDENEDGDI